MVRRLTDPQPVFSFSPLDEIPDEDEDKPVAGNAMDNASGPLQLPSLVFGAATFSAAYGGEDKLISDLPVRVVRLALRYGITTFDTSAFYGPSEIILGTILKTLEPEFPRESYKLMTKCGRYGNDKADFDYSPETIRGTVLRSLERLNTTYLDTVYLHDVEFVCEAVQPRAFGNPVLALNEDKKAYGLAEGDEAIVHGPGDQILLDAIAELRRLKGEGLIRNIGITGYPLPTLLRLALLVLHTPPFEPLDVLLSYSHLNLQNTSFIPFAKELSERAHIKQLLTASPFSMGLLTPSPPPWHPAFRYPPLYKASRDAIEMCASRSGGLPDVALGYAYRIASEHKWPCVVGFSDLREVHESVRVWREVRDENRSTERAEYEAKIKERFKQDNVLEWSWASPPIRTNP